MIDVWKFTTYCTYSLTNHFFEISDKIELEKLSTVSMSANERLIFWWWSNLLLSKPLYKDLLFIKYSLVSKRVVLYEDDKCLEFEILLGEKLSKFVIDSTQYTNLFMPLFWLPGNLAGAVVWNAWSFGVEIWDYIKEVVYYDFHEKEMKVVKNKDLQFWYRTSYLKNKDILLIKAVFQIPKQHNTNIKDWVYYITERRKRQPIGKSCWSYFKNYTILPNDNCDKLLNNIQITTDFDKNKQTDIENSLSTWTTTQIPVWWLIDKCWIKWYESNWVQISPAHWNFILNIWTKNWSDIKNIWDYIKWKIFDKFGVVLEEEVRIV